MIYVNALARGLSLLFRFALTYYLAKYGSVELLGSFGVIYAIAASTPAVLGFGVNYFVNRKISLDESGSSRVIFHRLILGLGVYSIFYTAAAIVGNIGESILSPQIIVLAIVVVTLDAASIDVGFGLIASGKSRLANALLFIRSAVWIPVFIAATTMELHKITLDSLLYYWLAATLLNLVLAAKTFQLPELRVNRPELLGLFSCREKNWPKVYLADLALVGLAFSDRPIILYFSNLRELGIYTFYASLAGAAHTVAVAAAIQPMQKSVVEWGRSLTKNEFFERMGAHVKRTSLISFAIIICVLLVSSFGVALSSIDGIDRTSMPVMVVLLIGAFFKVLADATGQAMYSLKMDEYITRTNLLSVVACIALGTAGVAKFGALGAASGFSAGWLILFAMRARYLGRWHKQ